MEQKKSLFCWLTVENILKDWQIVNILELKTTNSNILQESVKLNQSYKQIIKGINCFENIH